MRDTSCLMSSRQREIPNSFVSEFEALRERQVAAQTRKPKGSRPRKISEVLCFASEAD